MHEGAGLAGWLPLTGQRVLRAQQLGLPIAEVPAEADGLLFVEKPDKMQSGFSSKVGGGTMSRPAPG